MPGGRTAPMGWAGMHGHAWPGAAASFITMWTAMMMVMMLPSLVPALRSFHRTVHRSAASPRALRCTAVAAAAYYAVWAAIGVALLPLGAALAVVGQRVPELARVMPLAAALAIVTGGALQCTAWKARRLARCRSAPACGGAAPPGIARAWRHGVRLGVHCAQSCAGLTAILLAAGIMDVRAMLAVTAAITAERLAPNGARVARVTGALAVGVGIVLVLRAALAG